MKTITVTVRKKHWDEAMSRVFFGFSSGSYGALVRENECPLALALREKNHSAVIRSDGTGRVDGYEVKLDEAGMKFISTFDDQKWETEDDEKTPKLVTASKIKLPKKVKMIVVI